jgi:Sec-independent protein translocase protein TatA
MGSLSFGEILTIVVVILIIFGPNRLPEFSRKVGEFVAKARNATRDFTDIIQSEMGDSVVPIKEIADDFEGIRKNITDAASAMTGGTSTSAAIEMPQDDDPTAEFPADGPDDNGPDPDRPDGDIAGDADTG